MGSHDHDGALRHSNLRVVRNPRSAVVGPNSNRQGPRLIVMGTVSTPSADLANQGPPRVRWIFPIALALTVLNASGQGEVAGPSFVGVDKLSHFLVFGLLATLVARCPGPAVAWFPVLAVSAFGGLDEFRQSFTPGRFVEFADWVADTAGALVAYVLYTRWTLYRTVLETPLRLPGLRRSTPANAPTMTARA